MSTPAPLAPDYAVEADELLAALGRRNAAARRLEAANRAALEALDALKAADLEVSCARSRLAERMGVVV